MNPKNVDVALLTGDLRWAFLFYRDGIGLDLAAVGKGSKYSCRLRTRFEGDEPGSGVDVSVEVRQNRRLAEDYERKGTDLGETLIEVARSGSCRGGW